MMVGTPTTPKMRHTSVVRSSFSSANKLKSIVSSDWLKSFYLGQKYEYKKLTVIPLALVVRLEDYLIGRLTGHVADVCVCAPPVLLNAPHH